MEEGSPGPTCRGREKWHSRSLYRGHQDMLQRRHFNMRIWYFTIFPISTYYPPYWGFPDSSFGKQSTCNARDPASIPGLGRSAGEGIGYPFQGRVGFPCDSACRESACKAGDHSSIPGLGRSAGEGIGYPPQHCWASLVAQLVRNTPAMWETWVRSLGWEDPL